MSWSHCFSVIRNAYFQALESPVYVSSSFRFSHLQAVPGSPSVMHRQLRNPGSSSPVLSHALGPGVQEIIGLVGTSGVGSGTLAQGSDGRHSHLARWGTCAAVLTGVWGSVSMGHLLAPVGWAPKKVWRT